MQQLSTPENFPKLKFETQMKPSNFLIIARMQNASLASQKVLPKETRLERDDIQEEQTDRSGPDSGQFNLPGK